MATPPDGLAAPGIRRPRFTPRAAILSIVVLVLALSYASSVRAYVQQRDEIDGLKAAIAQRQDDIARLEREKRRWQDAAFLEAQARSRFGYLMPGETSYVVIGEDGKPLDSGAELNDPDAVLTEPQPPGWWSPAWESVKLAGHPPQRIGGPGPTPMIDGTEE